MTRIPAEKFEQELLMRGCVKTSDMFGRTGYVWLNPMGIDFSVPGPGADGCYSQAVFVEVLTYAGIGNIRPGSSLLN